MTDKKTKWSCSFFSSLPSIDYRRISETISLNQCVYLRAKAIREYWPSTALAIVDTWGKSWWIYCTRLYRPPRRAFYLSLAVVGYPADYSWAHSRVMRHNWFSRDMLNSPICLMARLSKCDTDQQKRISDRRRIPVFHNLEKKINSNLFREGATGDNFCFKQFSNLFQIIFCSVNVHVKLW